MPSDGTKITSSDLIPALEGFVVSYGLIGCNIPFREFNAEGDRRREMFCGGDILEG